MQKNIERLFFLDAARALLMVLGIFIHASQIFVPDSIWLIHAESSHQVYVFLKDALHTFRMPAFFIVSGFFCLFTIKKYGSNHFIKIRIKRIALPLLVTAVTLNTVQEVILYQTHWYSGNLSSYIKQGRWLSHLWFLVYLMIYFAFVSISYDALKNSFDKVIKNRLPNSKAFLFSCIFLFPFLHIAILALNKFGISIYFKFLGIIDIHKLLIYFTFFLFGMVLASRDNILIKFSSIKPKYSLSIIFFAILIKKLPIEPLPEKLGLVIFSYLEALSVLMVTSLLFCFFLRHFNKPSKVVATLADASYTIYLFHHLLVIALGILVIKYEIEHNVGFPLIVGGVFLTTLLIHRKLILKSKTLHLLFNGK